MLTKPAEGIRLFHVCAYAVKYKCNKQNVQTRLKSDKVHGRIVIVEREFLCARDKIITIVDSAGRYLSVERRRFDLMHRTQNHDYTTAITR